MDDNFLRYCYHNNGDFSVTCDGERVGRLVQHEDEVYLVVEAAGIPVSGLGGLESLVKFSIKKD